MLLGFGIRIQWSLGFDFQHRGLLCIPYPITSPATALLFAVRVWDFLESRICVFSSYTHTEHRVFALRWLYIPHPTPGSDLVCFLPLGFKKFLDSRLRLAFFSLCHAEVLVVCLYIPSHPPVSDLICCLLWRFGGFLKSGIELAFCLRAHAEHRGLAIGCLYIPPLPLVILRQTYSPAMEHVFNILNIQI